MNIQPKPIAMRDALIGRIWEAMEEDKKIFFVCADFGSPVLDKIRENYPDRFVNVGIAEQNLINISAGLALEGFTVFAYAIAPFITMRCYEQTRVSLALLSEVRPMNVNLIGVGAGYSYVVSGPTHQCYEDITLMRAMPNVRVLSPADHITAAAMFDVCIGTMGPKYLRLDAQLLPVVYEGEGHHMELGYYCHSSSGCVCIVATGYMLHTALDVASHLNKEGVQVAVIDLFDLTRFDPGALKKELRQFKHVVSLEEGFSGRGGLDALLFDLLADVCPRPTISNIGVKGGYRFELGSRQELHEQVGIGRNVVLERVRGIALSIVCH